MTAALRAPALDTWAAPDGDPGVVVIRTAELTAKCPLNGRRDFYTLEVRYQPRELIVESKSLRDYLDGYEDEKVGVEALAAKIRDDLAAVLNPIAATVELAQNVRGGLAFTAEAHLGGGAPRG